MRKQQHARRQHIINSMDTFLYQLHTLSFFLSPSLWTFFFRIISQFQCSKPRDLDASRSMRFFFTMVVFFNVPIFWSHATQGAAEGRALVLDFIGMAYTPTRLQLLSLDFFIVVLQLILTTIAFETSLYQKGTDPSIEDILLPTPSPSLPTSFSVSTMGSPTTGIAISSKANAPEQQYVIDLKLGPILTRLRNPPVMAPSSSPSTLPLPNTTPWPLPAGMRMLIRASARMRNETGGGNPDIVGNERERAVPGGLDA